MKRKLLTILLSLAMISIIKTNVFAQDFTGWTQFTSSGGTLDAGKYFLNSDVTLSGRIFISSGDVTIDLNGHALISNADSGSVIYINGGTLTIQDSDPTTEHVGYVDTNGLWHLGTGTGTSKTIKGGIITGGKGTLWPTTNKTYGGGVYVYTNCKFTMEGGTIIGNTASNGGGVYVNGDGTFNMTDGTICGNTGIDGSGVYVGDINGYGTFNMTDGTIYDNTAANCGGGLYVCGSFTMEDGLIENNKVTTTNVEWGGGGIVVYKAGKAKLSGGTIQNNISKMRAGGVMVLAGESTGSLTLTGVSIKNNTAGNFGGGINIYNSSNYNVFLGGNTVIDNNMLSNGTDNNFDLDQNNIITLGTKITGDNGNGVDVPASGMLVGVTISNNSTNTFADTQNSSYAGFFFADNPVYVPHFNNNKLELVKGWTYLKNALNGTAQTENGMFEISEDKNSIKLLADFKADTNDTTLTVSGTKTLDLNGHVIDANGLDSVGSVINVPYGASLTLDDSNSSNNYKFTVDNGLWKYAGKWTNGDTESDTVKKVTGGIITGGKGFLSGSEHLGGGIYVASGGTLTMNKGTIAGCSATKGGGVFTWGSFTMKNNSTIIGCKSMVDGGGVCACDCSFNMNENSKVSDCIADNGAGGVYIFGNTNVDASFTMNNNSIISNCKANATPLTNYQKREGGGVCVEGNKCIFTMNGGNITNNNANNNSSGGGVNVYSGTFNMVNGKIEKNTASSHGGGIYLSKYANVNITDGSIENNHSIQSGGGVQVDGNFKISSGTIKLNKANNDGGGLSINSNTGEAILTGNSKILNNTADNQGGGVSYYGNSTKNVFLGGSIQITGNVTDGTIVNNVLSGGTKNNVYFYASNLYLTLGTSTNGTDGNKVLEPTEDMLVGVTSTTPPTDSAPIKITTNGTEDDAKYFKSDISGYKVKYNTGGYLELRVGHIHNFTYNANNNKIIATCIEECDEGYNTNPLTLTLTAPSSLVYDGNVKAFTFATGEADAWINAELELPEIFYLIKQTGQSEYLPFLGTLKNVGNYMAKIIVNEKTAQIEFSIIKKAPKPDSKPSKYVIPKTGIEVTTRNNHTLLKLSSLSIISIGTYIVIKKKKDI